MKNEHLAMTPYQRAKQWYETELDIFTGKIDGPNEFDLYVPAEAREESLRMRRSGLAPRFTDRHFKLWAALTEVLGDEEFKKPLGWEEEDARLHLLGMSSRPRA